MIQQGGGINISKKWLRFRRGTFRPPIKLWARVLSDEESYATPERNTTPELHHSPQ